MHLGEDYFGSSPEERIRTAIIRSLVFDGIGRRSGGFAGEGNHLPDWRLNEPRAADIPDDDNAHLKQVRLSG